MRLISRAHFLILVGQVWVGFNEFGDYVATEPYLPNADERDDAIRTARHKVDKVSHGQDPYRVQRVRR